MSAYFRRLSRISPAILFLISMFTMVFIICLSSPVLAQSPGNPYAPDTLEGSGAKRAAPSDVAPGAESPRSLFPYAVQETRSQDVEATSIPLGQPGLSYRYVQTFGEPAKAYPADTQHINYPYGIGVDGSSIWIGEKWGNRLLKYDSAGNFQQQFGRPRFPEIDEDTRFWEIEDITTDGAGNIWVVDSVSSRVVKLNPSGQKLLEVGKMWVQGSDNDQFIIPMSVALDTAGNIYVSDGAPWWNQEYGNHRIQIFDSNGGYRATIGQSGVCGSGSNQLCGPRHIEIDDSQLFITDAGNSRVQIFDISNPDEPSYVTTISGLNNPSGVAVDALYIYIADTWSNQVQVFDRGTRTLFATIGTGWGTGIDQFANPTDVAVDAAGNLYVADFANTRVQQFTRSGNAWNYVRTYGVTGVPYVTDDHHYNGPSGVAVDSDGNIYLTEDFGHRLIKLSPDGTPIWTVGAAGVKGDWDYSNTRLNNPDDVAIDANGRVYVASRYHQRVQIYSSDGSYHATVDGFDCPGGIAIAPNGDLYVADSCNHTVRIYNSALSLLATLGTPGESGSDNTHFSWPEDVAIDSSGAIYVSDRDNHRIQVFNASRAYLRTMGETGANDSDFGRFSGPNGLFVDAADRLYVADTWNNRIQIFDKHGNYLTTIGGSWGIRSGQFRSPNGVAVDTSGNVYVADTNNHRIQKFSPGVPGWIQTNLNGFGDPANANIHTLATFGGHLFAGTWNGAGSGAQLWKTNTGSSWTPAITPGFGITQSIGINHLLSFNNHLYAGVRNDREGGKVYRSSDGNTWDLVVTDGFGDPLNAAVYRFAVFDGQIYAGTGIFTSTHGAEIWRSSNGNSGTWTRIVSNGFDSTNNFIMRISEVHNGHLYFGTQNIDTSTHMTTTGGIVIRSQTGNEGNWSKVTANGFGDRHNYAVSGLASYGEYLYASTSRWDWAGIQVWRCQVCDSPDDWEKVVENGFGNRNNWGLSTLQVFNDDLYLIVGNGITGLEVWRTRSGNSGEWQKVVDGGFGDSNNRSPYFNSVEIFNGNLYIGAENGANGGELWQFLHNWLYLPTMMR